MPDVSCVARMERLTPEQC